MSLLDTSGRLLEGMRNGVGNNIFTFPPRNFIGDSTAFQALNTRAEYAIFVGSLDSTKNELEIADPDLVFYYTKNESTAIRFNYDTFGRRFFSAPGGAPNELGPIGNNPRLLMPVPDTSLTSAPYSLYIGDTTRFVTFNLTLVPTDGDFTNPISIVAGNAEISEESGKLNFSQDDIDTYEDQIVLTTGQSFFDRVQTKGSFGQLPASASTDYYLFLNPRPGSGQYPLIRIGYKKYLNVIEVPNEASLGTPAIGSCRWAADTGRVKFAFADIDQNLGQSVYYDGVYLGQKQLPTTVVGAVINPSPGVAFTIPDAIGVTDATRFIIAATLGNTRHYFPVSIINIALIPFFVPQRGTAYLNQTTGAILLSIWDILSHIGWSFSYTDTYLEIEDGVSVQFYRSGVNGSGTSVAPDFKVSYAVENQKIVSKIGASPIVLLPTVPIIDTDLRYTVSQVTGSVGTFTGDLSDGVDPAETGLGYLLDLDKRMFKYSDRKEITQTLLGAVSTIKLPDAAISQFGFEVTRNGNSITPGVDFDLDFDTGLVDFVQPVGENDLNNVLGISGTINLSLFVSLKTFIADNSVFSSSNVGDYLFVHSGSNVGIYEITKYINSKQVEVSPNFQATGPITADLRVGVEVVADRFWAPFLPPYKKFSLSKAATATGNYIKIENTEFNVFKNTGQVNLSQATFPGEHYQISYISLELGDDGVTQTPTNKVEKALFKVRQEQATVVFPGGSTTGPGQSTDRSTFLDALNSVDPEERSCDAPVAGPLELSTAPVMPSPGNLAKSILAKSVEIQSTSDGFKAGFIFGSSTGSRTAVFNPSGNTVSTERSIDVFVNGIPLTEDDFIFEAPGTLKFSNPIGSNQKVVVNYWIEEATGNDISFDLLHSPIDLDTPEIVAGEDTAEFNGNQTDVLLNGSAILIDDKEIIIIDSSTYDSSSDTTVVQFETTPTVSSSGAPLKATGPINGSYRLSEENAVDVFAQGSGSINIAGDRSFCYVEGTIITVDGDSYIVVSSKYDPNTNQTSVTVAGSAKRNYILPSVTRTIRPVLSSTGSFQTKYESHSDFPFTLVKMGKSERVVLIQNADYTVADGGMVKLSTDIEFGDALYAMYVARDRQPVGTVFTFNYSYAIAPDETNGLQGQELTSKYNLYSPDSFFYRVETVGTFLPEVSDLLKGGSQTSSGPNTNDVATVVNTKDSGNEGPYYEEKHQENLDIAVSRLLLFYNDLINLYEDILSNLDGRIVGGNCERFRFDGNFDNPYRTNYADVTNDIDDQFRLYDQFVLTDFFNFDLLPVYGRLGEPNTISRIFSTKRIATGAINDQTDFLNIGNTMGTLGIGNLRSADSMISSRSRVLIESVDASGTIFTIEKNGDADNLIPQFEAGQKVGVYNLNGALDTLASVVSADTNEPATVILDTATTLKEGSLLRFTSDPTDSSLHIYTPGRDLVVNLDNGEIINFTMPPALASLQNPVTGNEILDCLVIFNNTNSSPERIPVLDGEELNDDGKIPAPILKRIGESSLLEKELAALSRFGNGILNTDKLTVTSSTISVILGQTIKFLDGPNAGITRTVASVVSSSIFKLNLVFPVVDTTPRDFTASDIPGDDLPAILSRELGILNNNTSAPAIPPAMIGTIDSEINTIENIIYSYGEQISSGTGNATGVTLIDSTANFTADGVDNNSLLYVPSGDNRGLYKVDTVIATQINVVSDSPFEGFPYIGSTPYIVINTYDLISESGPEFITEFLRETLNFLNDTQIFASNPTTADKASRSTKVNARLSSLDTFVGQVEGILTGDQLYDIRYLWIDQRVNRKDGNLVKKIRAVTQRQDDIQKIINDQKKLVAVDQIWQTFS